MERMTALLERVRAREAARGQREEAAAAQSAELRGESAAGGRPVAADATMRAADSEAEAAMAPQASGQGHSANQL